MLFAYLKRVNRDFQGLVLKEFRMLSCWISLTPCEVTGEVDVEVLIPLLLFLFVFEFSFVPRSSPEIKQKRF